MKKFNFIQKKILFVAFGISLFSCQHEDLSKEAIAKQSLTPTIVVYNQGSGSNSNSTGRLTDYVKNGFINRKADGDLNAFVAS
ncbi:MAG: hypothetical protein ACKO1F_02170, partial [Flammeovirgaceae bacterium]